MTHDSNVNDNNNGGGAAVKYDWRIAAGEAALKFLIPWIEKKVKGYKNRRETEGQG